MKRWAAVVVLTCIVVGQKKTKHGFLTECQGVIENSQVILDEKIARGQEVSFAPFIDGDDEVIHGKIMGVQDARPIEKKVVSSEEGKEPYK